MYAYEFFALYDMVLIFGLSVLGSVLVIIHRNDFPLRERNPSLLLLGLFCFASGSIVLDMFDIRFVADRLPCYVTAFARAFHILSINLVSCVCVSIACLT